MSSTKCRSFLSAPNCWASMCLSWQTWWRHQIATFSALLSLCEVTGEFPSQRPVTRSLDVFFDPCLNKRLSKQLRRRWFETPWRSLWRHCNDHPYFMMTSCDVETLPTLPVDYPAKVQVMRSYDVSLLIAWASYGENSWVVVDLRHDASVTVCSNDVRRPRSSSSVNIFFQIEYASSVFIRYFRYLACMCITTLPKTL